MKKYELPSFLELLWKDYVETNPPAQKIHDLFKAQGENVVNDHIAFRTFNLPETGIDILAQHFKTLGYQEKEDYHFEKKKLYAKHFEHPDAKQPLIFISELKVEEFDQDIRKIIQGLVDQIPQGYTDNPDFLFSGKPWQVSFETYQTLKNASEYAAWMSAYGFRVNHFTVNINHLQNFESIQQVNQFLKDNGYQLNDSGGEVKGTPEVNLEQSSTIAYNKMVDFSDGPQQIPACYYEFAKRYPLSNGQLFKGFIAGSADKIFESTDKGQDIR